MANQRRVANQRRARLIELFRTRFRKGQVQRVLPEAKQQVTKGHKATLLAKYRSEYEKAQLCPNPPASASQNIARSEGRQLAQAVMSRKNGISIANLSEPHVYTYIYR